MVRPFCEGILSVTSNASISSRAEWQSLSETPRQLYDELTDAERLIDELFDEMQRMRQEMASLQSHRDQLTANLKEEENQSQQCKIELATVTATLEECRTQAEQTAQKTASELAALKTESRETIERERQQASAVIEEERERATALIEQEKERTRQAIEQERERAREAIEREKQSAGEPAERERLRAVDELEHCRAAHVQTLEAMQRELAEAKDALGGASQLENTISELEVELDLTRTAAAENKRQWSECQRELSAERASRQGDMAEMRKLLERFFERWSEDAISRSPVPSLTLTTSRPFVPVAATAAPNETLAPPLVEASGESAPEKSLPESKENKPSSSSLPSDPVVHSVMAQFSKLQKDVARRRGKRT